MQRSGLALVRDNISDAVAVEVRKMIVDGRLPAGGRINEVHLSEQLGVSRTPLREALARLTQEGALDAVPRIGYFVRPLTVGELEEIYAIRPLLEPEALRLAGIPSRQGLEKLRAINERIADESDADRIIALDDEWHAELTRGCPNRVLLGLIDGFITRTRRYEIALMRESRNVSVSTSTHRTIIAALRRGNLDAACAALRKNLEDGRGPIVNWLRARESAPKAKR